MINENVTAHEIDLSYLTTVSGGDKVFEMEMIQSLTGEIDQRMQAVQTAALADDVENIRLHSHSLKNLYAMLGLQGLQESFQAIEAGFSTMTGPEIISQVLVNGNCWIEKKTALENIIAAYRALAT